MKDRLQLLPSEHLVSTLLRLQADFDELKNRQTTSGASGVLGYLSKTNSTWDLTESLNTGSLSVGAQVGFILTFTADGSQNFPVADPFLDLFINGTAAGNRLSAGVPKYSDAAGTAQLGNLHLLDKTYLSNQLVTRWRTDFTYFGAITYYAKAYAVGSTRGTVALTREF